MPSASKQLGQVTPANASAVSIYSPGASTQAVGLVMFVCNNSANLRKFSIYQDDTGSQVGDAWALFRDTEIEAHKTQVHPIGSINNSSGNISVDTDDNSSALTFTLNGTEIT